MLAKLLTYALAGAGYAAVCLAVTVAIAVPWLLAEGTAPALASGGMPATFAGVIGAGVAFGLLGVAVGALVRDQVAAVVGLLVYRFLAEPIVLAVPALHGWTRFLPGPAASGLAGSSLELRDFLLPWQGGLVLLGYAAVVALAGVAITARRDVAA